jgi:predicted small secreted protein
MKKNLAVMILSLGALCLTACHTMRGLGEDLQALGHAIKRAAQR